MRDPTDLLLLLREHVARARELFRAADAKSDAAVEEARRLHGLYAAALTAAEKVEDYLQLLSGQEVSQ